MEKPVHTAAALQYPADEVFLVSGLTADEAPHSAVLVGAKGREDALARYVSAHPDHMPVAAISMDEMRRTLNTMEKAVDSLDSGKSVAGVEVIKIE